MNWNGIPLTTHVVNTTQVTAPVGPSRVANVGLVSITVSTNSGTSAPAIFVVSPNNTFPVVLGLSPSGAIAGGAGFTLSVYGANFNTTSQVLWNGALRATTFVSAAQLTATIPASDIAQPGTGLVSVAESAPYAAIASAQPFAVTGAPELAGASLAAASDANGNHLLSVTGSGFASGSTVQWQAGGGAPASLPTTYLSPWQLSAVVTSSQYSALASQSAAITVSNTAGVSAGFTLP